MCTVFALSMNRRHGQTAWRMTVLFAIFYDDFLETWKYVELGSHSTRATSGTYASLNPTQFISTTSS